MLFFFYYFCKGGIVGEKRIRLRLVIYNGEI